MEGLHGKDDGFYYIRRCVELAKKLLGVLASSNPMVGCVIVNYGEIIGCVIVKYGEIVGEGFHPKAGQPHADVLFWKGVDQPITLVASRRIRSGSNSPARNTIPSGRSDLLVRDQTHNLWVNLHTSYQLSR
ncbi:putative diaminohydroxyphosphoribosylaminopyrimidine deaminase [Helianthus debilis subsp. tardiflorus]